MSRWQGLQIEAEGTGISRPLSEQVNLLGEMLGQAIREQAGERVFGLVEELRVLCKRAAMGEDPAAREQAEQIIRALNLPADTRGVVITSIDPASDAAEKGIRRGDVILSVNRQPVTSPAQVLAAVDAARRAGRSSVLLLVKRGQAPEAFVGVDISGQ